MTPADFIAKWKDNSLSERAGAQSHFNDLCDLLGVDKPSDPDNYCFERGAKKTGSMSGKTGWADVWKRHCFAWEYKGPDANLGPALKQLMTYALALDNPPLLVVSDRKRIEIHTHFTGTPSEVWTIAIEDIGTPENLQRLRWLFTDPDQFKPQRTRTAITLQAAKLIGDLAWDMQQRNHDPHQVAHFLNKIIFCLFAEDAKGPASEPLLPNRLFSKVLETGLKDVERFQRQLKNLFGAMANRHGEFGEHLIQWFNGGLFDDDLTLPLTRDDLEKLTNVGMLDWSAIEPSIFGTLFERGLDPAKRSQLGAHYTDPVSIMRIVNPVIVEPLLAEWAEEKAQIASQMAVLYELESSKKSADKAKATNALKEANRRYIAFKERLKNFKVLDPACGSGNFLYLALQSLKDIELRVDLEAESLGLQRGFPEVGPQSMHGIELSPYAAELARVTVWIGDIQWMLKHGFAPSKEPILKTLDGIQCRDSLLAFPKREAEETWRSSQHRAGQLAVTSRVDFELLPDAVQAGWPVVDVIIGNPPFLGDKKMREEMGAEYTETLRQTYVDDPPGGADLVCYWFAKARRAIEMKQAKRAGLVATNSIRGGLNRSVLDSICKSGRIFHAWSDQDWINEGAAVRVSLVCFEGGDGPKGAQVVATLDGKDTGEIYADLTGSTGETGRSVNLTLVKKLAEGLDISFQGVVLIGPFEVDASIARDWLVSPNPHRSPNSLVLRPITNGRDITSRSRDLWTIDFASMSEADACLFELPFSYASKEIRPIRQSNSRKNRRDFWWRHGESGYGWRAATRDLDRYVATSQVAKHRVFVWQPKITWPHQTVICFARSDDTFFGVLHSRIHTLWALRLGTSLEDRPRYTPTTTFETFPFPKGLTPNLKPEQYTNPHAADIATAAKRLNELRENWLNPPEWVDVVPEVVAGYPDRIIPKPEYAKAIKERTLTNLYNKRAAGEVQWLEDAHRTLDMAVARAYGWDDYTPEMPDEEILRRLLKLNLERAKQ